tara:strand:+ start:826 stop:999 length:174 start_codon:yes stop_codon:yes gene_type:complete
VEDGLINIKKTAMCSSGAHYIDEEHYEREKADKAFYNKNSDKWDYYSGLPGVNAYKE